MSATQQTLNGGTLPGRSDSNARRRPQIQLPKGLWIGGILVILVLLCAVFAGWISPHAPNKQDYFSLLKGPGVSHLLGTDELGRDEFSRVLFGARTSMEVAFGAVAIGLIISVPVGLMSGFYRGWVDNWIVMRIVDALQAFPSLILALVLAAVLGPGIRNSMIAIAIGYLPVFIRIIRGQVISEVEKEYVQAARMIGATNWHIMFFHILRNIRSPLIVQVSLALAGGVVAEASLSYLGLGAQPPTASWGTMLHTAQSYIGMAPWLAVAPGVAVVIAVLGFNVLGEGLQDYWDPKAKK